MVKSPVTVNMAESVCSGSVVGGVMSVDSAFRAGA